MKRTFAQNPSMSKEFKIVDGKVFRKDSTEVTKASVDTYYNIISVRKIAKFCIDSLADLENQKQNYQKQLIDQEQQQFYSLRNRNTDLGSGNSHFEEDHSVTQVQLNVLEENNKILTDSKREQSLEYIKLKSILDDTEKERQQLDCELNGARSEIIGLRSELDLSINQNKSFQKEFQEYTVVEKEKLDNQMRENEKLVSEKKQSEEDHYNVKARLNALEEKNKILEGSKRKEVLRCTELEGSIREKERKFQQLNCELNGVRSELNTSKNQNETYVYNFKILQKEIDENAKKLKSYKENLRSQIIENENLREANKNLGVEKDRLINDLHRVQSTCNIFESQLQSHKHHKAEAGREVMQLYSKVRQSENSGNVQCHYFQQNTEQKFHNFLSNQIIGHNPDHSSLTPTIVDLNSGHKFKGCKLLLEVIYRANNRLEACYDIDVIRNFKESGAEVVVIILRWGNNPSPFSCEDFHEMNIKILEFDIGKKGANYELLSNPKTNDNLVKFSGILNSFHETSNALTTVKQFFGFN